MSGIVAAGVLMAVAVVSCMASGVARACERRDESDALDKMDALG